MKLLKIMAVLAVFALLMTAAGCERKVVNEGKNSEELTSCFTCHADNDSRLLQAKGEWQNSVHASGTNVDYTNRAGRPCAQCHQHQGFVDFITTGTIHPPYANAAAIHCFTCHAPHSTGTLNLRTEAAVTLANGDSFNHGAANLCARCHQSQTSVTTITDNLMLTSNRWGPHHAPQADMLQGTNGFEIAGYDYESSGHAGAIEEGCVGCHMANPQIHDGYKVGGHSWNMIDEETGTDMVAVCNACHPDAESYDYEGIQTEVEEKLGTLRTLLVTAGVLADFDGEYLPNVPTDDTLIIADKNIAGALLNYLLIEGDRSEGVHNAKYILGLLDSSIDYLQTNLPGLARRGEPLPIAAH
jgi:formate-dependent nitrite reductase cytochrome c552 subunit